MGPKPIYMLRSLDMVHIHLTLSSRANLLQKKNRILFHIVRPWDDFQGALKLPWSQLLVSEHISSYIKMLIHIPGLNI